MSRHIEGGAVRDAAAALGDDALAELLLERTPARAFGISHVLVVEKTA